MASTAHASTLPHPRESGLLARAARTVCRLAGWLLAALVFSLVLEWVGLTFWWPDEGTAHSARMLEAEIGYLNRDFRRSLVSAQPAAFVRGVADTFYHYAFAQTGIAAGIKILNAPACSDDPPLLQFSRALYRPVADYIIAGVTITQVFAVRLAVLALASPLFALAALVGLTDGLIERDRRRFGGAREKGLVYHHVKRFVVPSLIGAWVVYLSLPITVHPNVIIVPFAVLFGLSLGVTAATFKKYL